LMLLIASVGLTGCRSYQPRPLDLAAYDEIWKQRSPSAPEVIAFANGLADRSPDSSLAPFDPSDGLSLSEAEKVALVFNPDLRLARLRAKVAAAGVEHAGDWDDPAFNLELERILESVSDPWVIASSISFTVPLSGRLGASKNLASAEHVAALAEAALEEWQTVQRLRSAWVNWSALRLQQDLLANLAQQLEGVASAARRMYEVGELDRPQSTLFELERLTRANELREIDGEVREAQIELHALMGLTSIAAIELQPTVAIDSGRTADSELISRLAEANPRLKWLHAEYEGAERLLALEVKKQYPDLVIGPGYGTDEGDSRALLGISLPLPLLNANRRAIAEAEARRELARATFETAFERAVAEAQQKSIRLETASALRASLEQTVVPLADQQLADVRRLVELGELDPLLVLETVIRTHETKLRLIDSRVAESMAAIDLEFLIGPPAADSARADETNEVLNP
jgi:outer membrane protein, heavy metal efflux system